MKPPRKMACLFLAALLSTTVTTGVSISPALAAPSPPTAQDVTPPPAAPTTAANEETQGAPTSVHFFETAPLKAGKGDTISTVGTEAYSLSRTGNIKVRLVTVQLSDVKAPIAMDSAVSAVQATNAYWSSMSNGRLSMSVASTETVNSSASSAQSYSSMMDTITRELGWVPNPYTALVVFVSSPTLSDGAFGAGWSYNGTSGRVIMPLPANLTKSVLTHEFGHVLGLMHANSLECGSGAQDVATNSDGTFADPTCRVREYGDALDLMGVSHADQPVISSTLWDFGGFGTGREIRNLGPVGASTTLSLTAWAGGGDGRAAKFTDSVSGEVYYLELRLPVGYDTTYAVNGNRGVKIVQQLGAASLVLTPDSRPFAGYYSPRLAWQAGQTFTTHAGTQVKINWVSDSAASVTIESTPAIAGKAIAGVAASASSLGSATSGVICGLRGGGCFQGFQNGAVMWSPATGAQPSFVGPVRDAWQRSGFENGTLGYPTSGMVCGLKDGGCFQNYQGGSILWSPSSGAVMSTGGAIRDYWAQQRFENGPLGYPTSDPFCGLKGGGCFQNYQGGTVMWSPASGAQTITAGPVQQVWQRSGFENGALGYPINSQSCDAAVTRCTQAFQGGTAAWSSASGGWAVPTTSAAAWRAAEVGFPVGAQTCGLRAGGCFQNFEQGVIMSAASGSYALTGTMLNEWQKSGFENGSLGYPTSAVTCGLKDTGCFQNFEKASVLSSPATGTHPIYVGPLLSTWGQFRFENGILGYPVQHQVCGIKNGGCFQSFQGGAIMWSAPTGAHVSATGPIRTLWQSTGFENGSLGYPTGEVTCGLRDGGCYQNYEGGAAIWKASSGAQPSLNGPIRNAWQQSGFENGPLGYPTSAQFCGLRNGGCFQNFEGGTVMWSLATGARLMTSAPVNAAWAKTGFENGSLGYPTSAVICGLKDAGCFENFEKGTIMFSPTTGAQPMTSGPIQTAWAQQRYENGPLGYPTNAQNCTLNNSYCTQTFQGGTITWTPTNGTTTTKP